MVIELVVARAAMFGGLDLRVRAPFPADAMAEAVAAAAAADVAVVVVGTNDDWETEGEDRTFLGLPGDQDALVAAVLAANPRTIVVVNTGSPVTMPWADDVPAMVQSWLGGQEMARALVDVLTGVSRARRSPADHVPVAAGAQPVVRQLPGRQRPGAVRRRAVHRLSLVRQPAPAGAVPVRPRPVVHDVRGRCAGAVVGCGRHRRRRSTVQVPVTNTGSRAGSHVVQCYVRPHRSRIVRPDRELKAFGKVTLAPGESAEVTLTLDARAFAYWDPAQPEWPALRARQAGTLPQLQAQERTTDAGWTVEPGSYDILIGNSATDIVAGTTIELVSKE